MTTTRPLELQVCRQCKAVQYPVREVCRNCLGAELITEPVDDRGSVLSWTRLHASLEPEFRDRLPLLVASIHLDAGPVVLARWNGSEPAIGQPATVAMSDNHRPLLVATQAGVESND